MVSIDVQNLTQTLFLHSKLLASALVPICLLEFSPRLSHQQIKFLFSLRLGSFCVSLPRRENYSEIFLAPFGKIFATKLKLETPLFVLTHPP